MERNDEPNTKEIWGTIISCPLNTCNQEIAANQKKKILSCHLNHSHITFLRVGRLIGRNVTLIKCNKMSKNISCQTESCILNDILQIQRIFLWTWSHVYALQILRVTKQAKGTRLAIVFETTKSDYQVMASNGQKPSDYSSSGKWLSPLNDDQNNKRIKKFLNYWKYSNCKLVLQLL